VYVGLWLILQGKYIAEGEHGAFATTHAVPSGEKVAPHRSHNARRQEEHRHKGGYDNDRVHREMMISMIPSPKTTPTMRAIKMV
jgi:hypothetical protein